VIRDPGLRLAQVLQLCDEASVSAERGEHAIMPTSATRPRRSSIG
jgi:hypothetical protein